MPKKIYVPKHIKGRLASARRKGWVKTLRKKQHDKCYWCHEPLGDDVTLEHLVPLSKNGEDSIENAAAAHSKCNSEKGDMMPETYRRHLKRKNGMGEK